MSVPVRFACRLLLLLALLFVAAPYLGAAENHGLPFETVFKGRERFDELVRQGAQWRALPIGERTAAVGRALVGTRYKSYTLEIDDRIEAPSVNFYGLDCWTFFEVALGFARLLEEPPENWTPAGLLRHIEIDRYRGGVCTGSYISRLHYLEDWLHDNDRRGLVSDLTRSLGGIRGAHAAREMTIGWRNYRYMRNSSEVRAAIARMEQRIGSEPLYYIPKSKVAGIESKLQSGDIIGICSQDGGQIGTSHVGLALRTADGTLRFMHASSPRNYGKVVVDDRLSRYLYKYRTHAGILVARPLK